MNRSCEEPVPVKRGRPKRKAEGEAKLVDPRLAAAQQLLLRHPQVIFDDPILGAESFGVSLSALFFVCSLPPDFDACISMEEYQQRSAIRFISDAMVDFLGVSRQDCLTQAAIKWLNATCSPACVRGAMCTPLLANCVREWRHKRLYESKGQLYECDVRGQILPSLSVMFVQIVDSTLLDTFLGLQPSEFEWDDIAFDSLLEGF